MAEAQARDGKDTPKGKQPEPTSRDADETSTAGANASGSASTAPPTTSGADSTSRPPASASASEPAAQPWLEGSIGDEEDHNTRTMYYVIRQAPLRHNYAVLVLNSFGLQHSLDHPSRGGLDKAQCEY